MIILALDASTYTASVALFQNDELLAEIETKMRSADRETLLPAVDDALRAASVSAAQLERVVCGGGPGSFTSLRIAASVAKGLAYARSLPLDVVPSLALVLVDGAKVGPGAYLACLDALRGQSYVSGYTLDDTGEIKEILPLRLVNNEDVPALADSIGATPIGPEQFVRAVPYARGARRAASLVEANVDLASWEPVYGRKAEAQARWEAAHGRPLPTG